MKKVSKKIIILTIFSMSAILSLPQTTFAETTSAGNVMSIAAFPSSGNTNSINSTLLSGHTSSSNSFVMLFVILPSSSNTSSATNNTIPPQSSNVSDTENSSLQFSNNNSGNSPTSPLANSQTGTLSASSAAVATSTENFAPSSISKNAAPICPPYLNHYLRKELNNPPSEVRKLQTFLKDREKIDVEVNGIFDDKTVEAVKKFQLRYASEILKGWETSAPTGVVYITTRTKINDIVCGTQSNYTALKLPKPAMVFAVSTSSTLSMAKNKPRANAAGSSFVELPEQCVLESTTVGQIATGTPKNGNAAQVGTIAKSGAGKTLKEMGTQVGNFFKALLKPLQK